jgi:hypothetical protein
VRHEQQRRLRARGRHFPPRACSRTASRLAISPAGAPRDRRSARREAARRSLLFAESRARRTGSSAHRQASAPESLESRGARPNSLNGSASGSPSLQVSRAVPGRCLAAGWRPSLPCARRTSKSARTLARRTAGGHRHRSNRLRQGGRVRRHGRQGRRLGVA